MKFKRITPRYVFNFLLMISMSLLFLFFILESATRIFVPQSDSLDWLVGHPEYGAVNKANYSQKFNFAHTDFVMDVKINSYGLRDKEFSPKELNSPDITRILAIGDSGTFGFGVNVEERFSSKLEELLNKDSRLFLVINQGVCGWGTIQETLYAYDHLKTFNPDIIILTFCGNDFGNNEDFKLGLKNRDKGVVYFPGKKFLRSHSHLYRYLSGPAQVIAVTYLKNKRKMKNEKAVYDKESSSVLLDDQWAEATQIIEKFQKDFLDYNPRGLFFIQTSNPTNPTIRSKLKAFCCQRNIVYVDLFDRASLLPEKERKLKYDGHWSRAMHKLSAESLAEAVLRYSKDK